MTGIDPIGFWRFAQWRREDGCTVWVGPRNQDGYGRFRLPNGRRALAHRIAYELQKGPIPKGMCVCHRCDHPECLAGHHLFLGTRRDNIQDAARKGRMLQRVTLGEAERIRELVRHGVSVSVIARQFGVSPGCVKGHRLHVRKALAEAA